jgi:hypothetical protein
MQGKRSWTDSCGSGQEPVMCSSQNGNDLPDFINRGNIFEQTSDFQLLNQIFFMKLVISGHP